MLVDELYYLQSYIMGWNGGGVHGKRFVWFFRNDNLREGYTQAINWLMGYRSYIELIGLKRMMATRAHIQRHHGIIPLFSLSIGLGDTAIPRCHAETDCRRVERHITSGSHVSSATGLSKGHISSQHLPMQFLYTYGLRYLPSRLCGCGNENSVCRGTRLDMWCSKLSKSGSHPLTISIWKTVPSIVGFSCHLLPKHPSSSLSLHHYCKPKNN